MYAFEVNCTQIYLTGCILLEHYKKYNEAVGYFMSAAKYWLTKAAEKGYEPSIKRLKMLKTAAILNKISSWIPSSTPSYISNQIGLFSETTANTFENRKRSHMVFQDV